MNYYNEIKNKIIDNEVYSKVKDYSKERYNFITYFEIGKLLDEAGSKYGDNILNDNSNRLVVVFGIKYNERTECLKMKNGRQWQPNYLGVIILNYYLLKMKMNCYIMLTLLLKKIHQKEN